MIRRVLGIETSCDETSASVVEDGVRVLSNVIASQVDMHAQWGGVVPEAAARMHVERVNPVVQQALNEAGVAFTDIHAIAVTNRPGLVGALVVGVAVAKAYAFVFDIPLIGVHHLEGHIASVHLADPELTVPFVCLIASGGHTELVRVNGVGDYESLGRTLDDAAGEAFDKAARLLGLGYPGGPMVEMASVDGDASAIAFPRAWLPGTLNFSFSGLKTAVRRYVDEAGEALNTADAAASFQQAVIDVLVSKAIQAAKDAGVGALALVGGVAANQALKSTMGEQARATGLRFVSPEAILCTDNAAMIAAAGYGRLQNGERGDFELDVHATAPLSPVRLIV